MHRMFRTISCLALGFFLFSTAVSCRTQQAPQPRHPAIPTTLPGAANNDPPPAAREFRGTWVATVGNIDWPSKPGLSTREQQDQAIQILDRCKECNLNAVIFQVRTTADAVYESKLEPWSYFLTGEQGKAPDPYYDPLKFWIDEAHKRGLELHAWFNPYRTRFDSGKTVIKPAANHVSVAHPEYTVDYGKMGWMDPGVQAAQDHTFAVFMDVVERYDVDGIHIDDYFYPYPEKLHPDDESDDRLRPFPDDESYSAYRAAGGKLDRAAWRRSNIDALIKRLYEGVKARKPKVKFGVSPFGIPRPALDGIEYIKGGFDQYQSLNADVVKWLQNGWCDYFVPQCYWKIGSAQPFLSLIQWWADHNPKHRNIYAGLFTSKIDWDDSKSWSPDEIFDQIMLTRLVPGITGHVHFSQIAIDQNRKALAEDLRDGIYARQALAPASPWLDRTVPAAPTGVKFETIPGSGERPKPTTKTTKPTTKKVEQKSVAPFKKPATTKPFFPMTTWETKPTPWLGSMKVTWDAAAPSPDAPFLYVVYYKLGDDWKYKIVPATENEVSIKEDNTRGFPCRLCVTAVTRGQIESERNTIVTGLETPKKK